MYVPEVASTAVTLITTATGGLEPVIGGIPALPATWMFRTPPAPTAAFAHPGSLPLPMRVSQRRLGATPENCAPCVPVLSVYQPSMSTATLTDPTPFAMLTVQFGATQCAGTGTITRFGTTAPAGTLIFDAFGVETLLGYAVSTVPAVGVIAVRLKTTALTPVDGTGLPEPWISKVSGWPARMGRGPVLSHWLTLMPEPDRVSQMRVGGI